MKYLHQAFEDAEMDALLKSKGKKTWHDFIFSLAPNKIADEIPLCPRCHGQFTIIGHEGIYVPPDDVKAFFNIDVCQLCGPEVTAKIRAAIEVKKSKTEDDILSTTRTNDRCVVTLRKEIGRAHV
jgi:hypothetical protein